MHFIDPKMCNLVHCTTADIIPQPDSQIVQTFPELNNPRLFSACQTRFKLELEERGTVVGTAAGEQIRIAKR